MSSQEKKFSKLFSCPKKIKYNMVKKLLGVFFSFLIFLLINKSVLASCSGTPAACGSIDQSNCASCGCTGNVGYCNNNRDCTNNNNETTCTNCSCAGCSWGGTSCPWVASWDGDDWVIEHEAFPFAAFNAVQTTSYDSLVNARCINDTLKVKIYEGLPEITYLKNFSLYEANNQLGLVKPDLNGVPRVFQGEILPSGCLSSDGKSDQECLALIKSHDGVFWEPDFNEEKTEDWLELEFLNIEKKSSKLYLIVRKQALLTSYYEYMAHIMGKDNFYYFSSLSTKPVFKKLTNQWWSDHLKMKVEVWDGYQWKEKGLISAGYHMPGSGADDFLVSLENPNFDSNLLKVRLKFLTGAFAVDYAVLDISDDPIFTSEKLSPREILFNDQHLENFSELEMEYDDSLVLTYTCKDNHQYYLAIEGYYLPDNFPVERKKSNICAWQELIRFFLSDKKFVVRNAQEKGLYKSAFCLNAFSTEEIEVQQKGCLTSYLLGFFIIALLIILLIFFTKNRKKTEKICLLLLMLGVLSASWRIIAIKANGACSGTLSCANCNQASCTDCTQCTWVPATCTGTAKNCKDHDNQNACQACGCTWQHTGLFLDVVDSSDGVVSNPSVNFTSTLAPFSATQTVGTLGVGVQRIRVYNDTSTSSWTLSIAATGGGSSTWSSTANSYKYNGLQSEGRLRVNPSLITITPSGSSCTSTGLTPQSAQYFEQGLISSIDLVIAGISAQTNCTWYIEGIGLTQDIPARQASGNYSLAMTITVI